MRQCTTQGELAEYFGSNKGAVELRLLQSGYHCPISSICIDMKDDMLCALIDYHCLIKNKAMADQFGDGLQLFGTLNMVRRCPKLMKQCFVIEKCKLSAGNQMDNLSLTSLVCCLTTAYIDALFPLLCVDADPVITVEDEAF